MEGNQQPKEAALIKNSLDACNICRLDPALNEGWPAYEKLFLKENNVEYTAYFLFLM